MDYIIEWFESYDDKEIAEIFKLLGYKTYKDINGNYNEEVSGFGSRLGGEIFSTIQEACIAQFGEPIDIEDEEEVAEAYNKIGNYHTIVNQKSGKSVSGVFEETIDGIEEFFTAMDCLIEEHPEYNERELYTFLINSEETLEELEELSNE